MEKINEYRHVFLILVILGVAFYWYSYRPEQIRKNCYTYVENREYIQESTFIPGSIADLDSLNEKMYTKCLLENGLRK